jgi:hypothetical protein
LNIFLRFLNKINQTSALLERYKEEYELKVLKKQLMHEVPQ